MNIVTTLLLFFVSMSLCGQKSLDVGLGILHIDIGKISTLEFYNERGDAKPAKKVEIIKNRDDDSEIADQLTVEKWFDPETLWLDYFIFNLRVKDKNGIWFNVVVNNSNGKTMWMKMGPGLNFQQWEQFLLNTTSISADPGFTIQVKIKPDDESETLRELGEGECLQVIEIKGEWMRIKTNEFFDCDESEEVRQPGWIKWKQENHLIISYALTC